MLNRQLYSAVFCFLAIGMFTTVGCGPAATPDAPAPTEEQDHDAHDHDDHGHDDHAHGDHDHDFDTLAGAADAIEEIGGEIGAGLNSDDPESAHDALHGIGDVLGDAEKLVKESSLEGEAKEAATKAVEDLFDAFGAIDEKLHGHDGKDYDEVKDKIESAIKTLRESAK